MKEPAYVVFDAQTEFLADAGLNENLGTDIEKWSQPYVTPARRLGATTAIIDHTSHAEGGRMVASRQKGAAAKVELCVKRVKKFDRDKVGLITVECTKNTVSAPIPEKQSFEIGGKDGGFVFDEARPDFEKASKEAEQKIRLDREIEAMFREQRDHLTLTQNAVVGMLVGQGVGKAEIVKALQDLAASSLSLVTREPGGPRGATLYSIND
jgi:hypothetical protein